MKERWVMIYREGKWWFAQWPPQIEIKKTYLYEYKAELFREWMIWFKRLRNAN